AKKHWAESEKRALVDATFQVIVQAIQKSSGRLSFANFAITAFDEDSIKFMREAYDRYAVDNSMQPPLKLMQGIYTDKIANSKLGSNWVPVCRQPDGNLYLSESGLYVIDTSLNQTYISDAFEKFKKNGACAVDMPTCDVKEEMAVACCAQELMITAALQDTRAKFEFLLEIIGALSSLMPEVPKEKLNDILFMNQLKKCFPYVTNDQYSQEQLKLVLAISEDLVSREDLEHVEMIRMMGVAIKNKVSVIYKADDIESATNALEAIYKGYVHELLKDKSGLFFSGSHHVVSNVSEESSKVQNPTPPRPV
ncbi:MAG: hypothetical protein KBD23_04775, partial [Gammaproteobacteria bacterium]|nr:hypothetical protein [Gammaproteobacteria bacterium]MBP9729431.1 hypothetical protein [Gammaproteobacteria bacterium]